MNNKYKMNTCELYKYYLAQYDISVQILSAFKINVVRIR